MPKPNSPRYDLLFNHLRQGIRSSEVAGVELDCHAVLIYFEQTSHRTFLDTCRICSDRLACNVASFKFRDVFHSNSMVIWHIRRKFLLAVSKKCKRGNGHVHHWFACTMEVDGTQHPWRVLCNNILSVLTSRHQNYQTISKDGMVALHGITSVAQSPYQHHLVS